MKQHTVQQDIESDALRLGFVKKRTGPDFRRVSWVIACSKCPKQFSAYWDPGTKPEAMQKLMRVRKWDVAVGMRPLCPDCAHAKDKGPALKPESQSFKPYIPPRTAMFDGLLSAAEDRAMKERINHGMELLLEVGLEIEDNKREVSAAKAERRTAMQEALAQAKLRGQQERCQRAREARLKRINDRKAAQDAGAKVLKFQQLKERAGAATPIQALEIVNAPQAEEEKMINNGKTFAPSPKITHAVFQLLDGVFDPVKRLYRSGYTDQRVAREAGTTEEIVAHLRGEVFGQLAEDPRYSALRDDLELFGLGAAESFAKMQKELGELRSRLEQLAHQH